MERVVIIGIDKDGNEYLSSSVADCAVIVWDLERAKYKLLTVPDMDDI
jgi:WD40 repeat protein